MAVGTLQIQIPIRALWWVKHLAVQQHCSTEQLVQRWVLEQLNKSEGVDLSRSPALGEQ